MLAVAVAGVGFFFGVQLTLFNNFVVERLGIEPHQLGFVEALREVPGFLNVLFVALMIRWAPPVVAAVALAVMGMGLASYVWVDSISSLALFSVIWSIGFHCWLPLEQAMGLTLSPEGEKGKWLGQLRSVQSLAWMLSIGVCILILPHIGATAPVRAGANSPSTTVSGSSTMASRSCWLPNSPTLSPSCCRWPRIRRR